ncbi:MAG: VTT domain-containing protein [Burkholderiales bacterium]|nr:VTT domain-containing protein [Burkholderiales bacterium]
MRCSTRSSASSPPIYTLGWRTHRRLHFHLDGRHPVGASHHQKIVVIDDALAFVGGLDLTVRRWDTPAHRADEPRRVDPAGEPYAPFHDVQIMVDGEAAAALGELARTRWRRATGGEPHPAPCAPAADPWPDTIRPDVTDVEVGIARTAPPYREREGVEEVKRLYLDAIRAARRSIYIENQYFTSAAVADALAARLAEPDGPQIVVVSRLRGGGWLEENTMAVLRARLVRRLRETDRHGRLRVYCPTQAGLGEACINLHAKLMIVDDRLVRVGSANLANRSMGLDTECDLAIEANEPRVAEAIAALRTRLLAEHLGAPPDDVADALARCGSLVAAIEALRGGARSLAPLDAEIDPQVDALVPDANVIDPEKPVDPEEIVEELVPPAEQPRAGARIAAFAALVVGIALLAAAWRWGPLAEWLDRERLAEAGAAIRGSALAPVWVLGAYAVAALTALPITLLIVATAVVFGPLAAFAYALAGALGGAMLGFGIGHWLGRDAVRRLAGARLNDLSRRLGRRGVLAVVAVRVLPVAPFTVVNLVAGASHIRLRDFVLGTVLGMAPGIAAVSVFADRLLAALHEPSTATLVTLVFVVAAIVAGAVAVRRWLRRRSAGSGIGRSDAAEPGGA